MYKPGKGAFYATGLEEDLKRRGITHLIFAGVTTEVGGPGSCCSPRCCWRGRCAAGNGNLAADGAPAACALLAQVCVQTSMREANDRGFECLLVTDATESYFPEFKASVVEMVHAQGGIVGWTADSAAVAEALAAAAPPVAASS